MKLKSLLASANNAQEADRILVEETGYSTLAEKKAFLTGLCECKELNTDELDELIYLYWLENLISGFRAL